MSLLVASAILLILGSAYAVLLKRKLAETIFLAVVTVILILYCFGFINTFGSLMYGVYCIIALAVLSIVFIVHKQFKERETLKNADLIRGSLLYIGFMALSVYISYGRVLYIWDEFSYWGTIVKHMYHADAFGITPHPNYEVDIASYIPGLSLFQYFFSRFSSRLIEQNMFIAMNMMYMCLIMPLVKDIFSRKKWIVQLILLVALIFLPTAADYSFYGTLYVDAMLGIFFGFSLLYYFFYRYEESMYGILIVTASVSMMVLTKHMGFPLALGVLVIVSADMIFFKRSNVQSIIKQVPGGFRKSVKIFILLLPLFFVLITRLSWEALVAHSSISIETNNLDSGFIFRFLTNQIEPYQMESRENFLHAMRHEPISFFRFSSVTFSIVFIIATIVISLLFLRKKGRIRMITASLLLSAGLYFYQFLITVLMASEFPERQAVMIMGYNRYTATYLVAMFMFIFVLFIVSYENYKIFNFSRFVKVIIPDGVLRIKDYLRVSKEFAIILVSFVLLLYVYTVFSPSVRSAYAFKHADVLYTERQITESVKRWLPYMSEHKPYVIDQKGFGYALLVVRYELMPNTDYANKEADWSINTEPFHSPPDDVFTFVVTPEEWEHYILSNGLKLVYVLHSDEILENTFGIFFPRGVQDDMLYRVQSENGRMILVPVIE